MARARRSSPPRAKARAGFAGKKADVVSPPPRILSLPAPIPRVELRGLPPACAGDSPHPGGWRLTGEAVVGLAHRRLALPCQDAVAWSETPRPLLVLADGAGSACVSELGAQAITHALRRFLASCEDLIGPWLDAAPPDPETAREQTQRWTRRLVAHAQGVLADLGATLRRPVADLRATLLLAVLGQTAGYALKIGDGAIVVQDEKGSHVLEGSHDGKGEFANETVFVDGVEPGGTLFASLFPVSGVRGIALMSDGAAERLVAHDGSRVAGRLDQWFEALADGKLGPEVLTRAFYAPEMVDRTSLDDRAIVLAARTNHG